MDDLLEYAIMAYMYAFTCTKQEEKFIDHKNRNDIDYTWQDAIAAYELINESTTGIERMHLYNTVRTQSK